MSQKFADNSQNTTNFSSSYGYNTHRQTWGEIKAPKREIWREIKIKKREIILFDYGFRWEEREREIEWA